MHHSLHPNNWNNEPVPLGVLKNLPLFFLVKLGGCITCLHENAKEEEVKLK